MVMRPLGWLGIYDSRLSSMKMNWLPDDWGAQVSAVLAPGVLLTLRILSSNSVPDPSSGTKSLLKADRRAVLIPVGGVGRMPIEMFQFALLVRPALCTGGVPKPTIDE